MIGGAREAHVSRSWTRVTFRMTLEHESYEPSGGFTKHCFLKTVRKTCRTQTVRRHRVTNSTVLNENRRPFLFIDRKQSSESLLGHEFTYSRGHSHSACPTANCRSIIVQLFMRVGHVRFEAMINYR